MGLRRDAGGKGASAAARQWAGRLWRGRVRPGSPAGPRVRERASERARERSRGAHGPRATHGARAALAPAGAARRGAGGQVRAEARAARERLAMVSTRALCAVAGAVAVAVTGAAAELKVQAVAPTAAECYGYGYGYGEVGNYGYGYGYGYGHASDDLWVVFEGPCASKVASPPPSSPSVPPPASPPSETPPPPVTRPPEESPTEDGGMRGGYGVTTPRMGYGGDYGEEYAAAPTSYDAEEYAATPTSYDGEEYAATPSSSKKHTKKMKKKVNKEEDSGGESDGSAPCTSAQKKAQCIELVHCEWDRDSRECVTLQASPPPAPPTSPALSASLPPPPPLTLTRVQSSLQIDLADVSTIDSIVADVMQGFFDKLGLSPDSTSVLVTIIIREVWRLTGEAILGVSAADLAARYAQIKGIDEASVEAKLAFTSGDDSAGQRARSRSRSRALLQGEGVDVEFTTTLPEDQADKAAAIVANSAADAAAVAAAVGAEAEVLQAPTIEVDIITDFVSTSVTNADAISQAFEEAGKAAGVEVKAIISQAEVSGVGEDGEPTFDDLEVVDINPSPPPTLLRPPSPPSSPPPSLSLTPSGAPSPPATKDAGLSANEMAGIAGGIAGAVVVLGVGLLLSVRARKQNYDGLYEDSLRRSTSAARRGGTPSLFFDNPASIEGAGTSRSPAVGMQEFLDAHSMTAGASPTSSAVAIPRPPAAAGAGSASGGLLDMYTHEMWPPAQQQPRQQQRPRAASNWMVAAPGFSL